MTAPMPAQRIHCAHLLTPEGLARDQCIDLDDSGLIIKVGPAPADSADLRLQGLAVPGLVNLHSHAFQYALAGRSYGAAPAGVTDDFWSWRQAMYRLAAAFNPRRLEAVAAYAYRHMLRGGYTHVCEFHYLHEPAAGVSGASLESALAMAEALFRAAQRAGIGLTLLPVYYERSGFAADSVSAEQQSFALALEDYLELVSHSHSVSEDRVTQSVGYAPHSLRAVGPQALDRLASEAAAQQAPLHIHLAEQQVEVRDCLDHTGLRPYAFLRSVIDSDNRVGRPGASVSPRVLIHGTHLDAAERQQAATDGAVMGLCPTTEADLGDGIFAADDWLQRRGRYGIGSDSNLRCEAAEELRWLEFGQRLRDQRRNRLLGSGTGPRQPNNGEALYRQAALGGGIASGHALGAVAAGQRADLLEIDLRHPRLQHLSPDQWLDGYVFASGAEAIRRVVVAGRLVLDRQPAEEDELLEQNVENDFRVAMEELHH